MLKNPINQSILTELLMIKNVILKLVGQYSYFIWLLILIIFTISVTYFYDINKKNQINSLNKALKNIYLSNSIK